MAGHSKWANIKHRKAKADARKGKIFSRLIKEIITAVRLSGPDAKNNPRLRLVLVKARQANIPNDTIERNIKKATSADQADFQDISYEIYGKGGVGIFCEGMTDNRNRAASDIRIVLNKHAGTIAAPGSVQFNFDRKGILRVLKSTISEDELFLLSTEAGAEDFHVDDELMYTIVTDPSQLHMVQEFLTNKDVKFDSAELEWIPKTTVACQDEHLESNLALIEALEELEDIDAVYHSME